MPSFKEPSFQERGALAAEAKRRALDTLRARQPLDAAVLAERLAAQSIRKAAQAKLGEGRPAARKAEKAAKTRAKDPAVAEKAIVERPIATELEKKATRDARYAARKNRVAKGPVGA